jgi:hypothetical protein
MSRMLLAVVGLLVLVEAPGAAPFDHLQCYKVRPDHGVSGTVDVASAIPELPAQAGCRVKGPKLFCGPIAKTLLQSDPPAPGAPPGPEAGSFLCYAARCAQVPATFQASDQFGTYSLRSRKSFLVCAPARPGTTTTSTTIPTVCGVSAPACNGSCPAGQTCVTISFGLAGSGCGCATPPLCGGTSVCSGNCPPGCICFVGGPNPCACSCP